MAIRVTLAAIATRDAAFLAVALADEVEGPVKAAKVPERLAEPIAETVPGLVVPDRVPA